MENLLHGLRRALRRVAPAPSAPSVWADYMTPDGNNYTPEHFAIKERFVAAALAEFAPRRVLDAGCNTGHFSRLAARAGAAVVAVDYDPAVVGALWRTARREKLDILPLAVNLTRPSPATGWANRECASFLARARGSFDAVFLLAVIHHMLVTERVPLPAIADLAAALTDDLAVVEFIAPEDSMFQRLLRGREELHRGLTPETFEQIWSSRFSIVRRERLGGAHRWVYLLRRRARPAAFLEESA
jgi:SAM-dependent methyltransferase